MRERPMRTTIGGKMSSDPGIMVRKTPVAEKAVMVWPGGEEKPLEMVPGKPGVSFSTTGNPPALPGDHRSLAVPGVNESLPSVNRSKFPEKEAFNEPHPKPKSFGLGLQVPRCLDTEISP